MFGIFYMYYTIHNVQKILRYINYTFHESTRAATLDLTKFYAQSVRIVVTSQLVYLGVMRVHNGIPYV